MDTLGGTSTHIETFIPNKKLNINYNFYLSFIYLFLKEMIFTKKTKFIMLQNMVLYIV